MGGCSCGNRGGTKKWGGVNKEGGKRREGKGKEKGKVCECVCGWVGGVCGGGPRGGVGGVGIDGKSVG